LAIGAGRRRGQPPAGRASCRSFWCSPARCWSQGSRPQGRAFTSHGPQADGDPSRSSRAGPQDGISTPGRPGTAFILLAGVILWLTGHFTGTDKRPTKDVARTSLTGAATVVLSGIGVGLESAVYTAVIIGAAVYGAFLLGGGSIALALFLVAVAGTGLLTTVGVIVAMDTFGPVSDNAQGIAEMSGDVDGEGAQILTDLDAVGNTTKAITKGIAIATAVLAATAVFGSFTDAWRSAVSGLLAAKQVTEQPSDFSQATLSTDVVSPNVLVGALLGAAVVFLFSGLAINAVTRAAGAIVFEVRRQFRDHPGIMDYTEKPDYARVVDICTKDSLRELTTPGLLAALTPVVIGFGLGIGALAGFLAGAISTGCLMAVFLANSGGSWDNAKKIVEDGHHGGKGSEAHAATVIGDTVGDPFKDTAGPAIDPLIKVMNLVSVLIAPAIISVTFTTGTSSMVRYGIALVLVIIVAAVTVSKPAPHRQHDRHSRTSPRHRRRPLPRRPHRLDHTPDELTDVTTSPTGPSGVGRVT